MKKENQFQTNTETDRIAKIPLARGHYIAGFVDGEGSFFFSARKRLDCPSGWKFSAHFNVSNNDKRVLIICKTFLGCGQIRNTRENFYTLEVSDQSVLIDKIVPFFRKFGFLSNKKKYEFIVFQKILQRLELGVQTRSNLEELLELRTKLGKYRVDRISNTNEMILKSFAEF